MNFGGAILVGIIEEVGKMIIVATFIKRLRNCKYVLNGLLVGGAVGAGFAVFESAGYAFNYLQFGYDSMVEVINLRAIMSPGGHVAWAAITGAAIMLALKGEPFKWAILKEQSFLRLFIIPIILHSIWDSPIEAVFHINQYLIVAFLVLAAWITLLVLIQNGLKEISRMTLIKTV